MALTALQQIMNEMDARLKNIKIVNGYDFNIARVFKQYHPFEAKAFYSDDLPVIFNYIDSDTHIGTAHCINRRQATVLVAIYSSGVDNIFDHIEQLGSATYIALNRSTTAPLIADTPSPRLNGIIEKMTLTNKLFLSGDEIKPWYGMLSTYLIDYIIDNDNPYVLSPP